MGGLFSKENPYVRKANLSGYVPVIEFKAYKDYAGNNFLSQSSFNAYKTQMGDDFQAFKDYSGKGFTSQAEFVNYKKIVDDFLVEYFFLPLSLLFIFFYFNLFVLQNLKLTSLTLFYTICLCLTKELSTMLTLKIASSPKFP